MKGKIIRSANIKEHFQAKTSSLYLPLDSYNYTNIYKQGYVGNEFENRSFVLTEHWFFPLYEVWGSPKRRGGGGGGVLPPKIPPPGSAPVEKKVNIHLYLPGLAFCDVKPTMNNF